MKTIRLLTIVLATFLVASCGKDKPQTPKEQGQSYASKVNELVASAVNENSQMLKKLETNIANGVYKTRQDANKAIEQYKADCSALDSTYQAKTYEIALQVVETYGKLEDKPIEKTDDDDEENFLHGIDHAVTKQDPEDQAEEMLFALEKALAEGIKFNLADTAFRFTSDPDDVYDRLETLKKKIITLPAATPQLADLRKALGEGWGAPGLSGGYFADSYYLSEDHIPDALVADITIDSICPNGEENWDVWFTVRKGDEKSGGYKANYEAGIGVKKYHEFDYSAYNVNLLDCVLTSNDNLAQNIRVTSDPESPTYYRIYNDSNLDVIVFLESKGKHSTKWIKESAVIHANSSARYTNWFVENTNFIKVVAVIPA